MKRALPLVLAGLAVLLLGCTTPAPRVDVPRNVVQKPALIIMGDDSDTDSIPRDSRVLRRFTAAVEEQMVDAGFAVYDESATSTGNITQARVDRTDAEWVDIARSVPDQPVDVMVFFAVHASAKALGHATSITVRTRAWLLDVRTGERLGNFEVEGPSGLTAPPNCARECIMDMVGSSASDLAIEAGAALREKLASSTARSPGEARSSSDATADFYTIEFQGFSQDQVMQFVEYLPEFSGYQSHELIQSDANRHEIRYESTIASARLYRNFIRMLEVSDQTGTVQLAGNRFTIERASPNSAPSSSHTDDW